MPELHRPLSPHIQVYRWQITSVLSITHRLTGLWLGVGALALSAWLVMLVDAPAAFRAYVGFFHTPLGIVLLVTWSWALFYHLLNGLRHLFWDLGWGFERARYVATGWTVVLLSLALTIVFWVPRLV
jgi:succinate dehydrogenase / fumarate reductase cytochrome b subunit